MQPGLIERPAAAAAPLLARLAVRLVRVQGPAAAAAAVARQQCALGERSDVLFLWPLQPTNRRCIKKVLGLNATQEH